MIMTLARKIHSKRLLGLASILFMGGMLNLGGDTLSQPTGSTIPETPMEKWKLMPGIVVKEMYDKELDIYQYVLSNNVRVNFKPMETSRISFRASFGRGELETPNQQGALPFATKFFFMKSGLRPEFKITDHDLATMRNHLRFSVDPDDFSCTGSTNDQYKLEHLLQLMCGCLTAPVYHKEALDEAHNTLEEVYRSLYKSPQGVSKDKVARFLANGDWKFGYPPREEVMAITIDQMRSFLEKPLKDSYLELTIVGGGNIESCLQTVLKTVGTLPMRDNSRPYLKELRNVQFPATPLKETFFVEDPTHPTAYVIVAWPTVDRWNWCKMIQLRVLAEIFTERLEWSLKKDVISHYTPRARSSPALEYNNYGYFSVYTHIKPKHADDIQEAFSETASHIRLGIGDEEFERAINILLEEVDQQKYELTYWQEAIDCSQEFPVFLEWQKLLKKTYQRLKKEDIQAIAKEFLHPQRAIAIKVLPRKST